MLSYVRAENMSNECEMCRCWEKWDSFHSCSLSQLLSSVGQQAAKLDNQFKVMSVVLHPSSPEVFLCGGYSSVVKAWDSRSCKVKLITLPTADKSFVISGCLYTVDMHTLNIRSVSANSLATH